jgi:hypothetical protein
MSRWAKFKKWMTRRPSGGAAGAFAVMDELFHPASREAVIAAQERKEAIAPMPSPEDSPFGGRITIEVPVTPDETPQDTDVRSVSSKP